jgi:formylglycine-generating enzyme required for sulfatase activity
MKTRDLIPSAIVGVLLASSQFIVTDATARSFTYESDRELISTGDFDGDGQLDVVIVDKDSGKYRIGYGQSEGRFHWVNFRQSGTKYVSWVGVGKLLDQNLDALAFVSADNNEVMVCEASNPLAVGTPLPVPFASLGPNGIVAVDIGGQGNTPLHDLCISSMYNSDPANRVALLRSSGSEFTQIADLAVPGLVSHPNRVTLKQGQPEMAGFLIEGETGNNFRIEDLSSGKPVQAASADGLALGGAYVFGNFRGSPLADFIFYAPGESTVIFRPVEEPSPGKFQFGAGQTFDLEKPIHQLFSVSHGKTSLLLVVLEDGASAALYQFDGSKAPAPAQELAPNPGERFFGAAPLTDGFVLFSTPLHLSYSTQFQLYQVDAGKGALRDSGMLPTLQDTDDTTVPGIHAKIMAVLAELDQKELKPYTNIIPGTTVTYSMVPIPGGEYVIGSPETEAGRRADEGQYKVKIEPFWMAQFEVTWDQYELFMYPEDERKLAQATGAETALDPLADAVTRPSKPYVEMTFGMGKYGYPAISMTQHGANKFCHWLSAKTGHFYRLPTEAEWEYAARAGTTSAYFFGDDPSQLGDYAWFGDNSDFKYQRIGRKKPNPWGLYDIYGNVAEWCLDQYDPDINKKFAGNIAENPWNKATQPYPHVVRGGSWDDDDPAILRSAARGHSDRSWKARDPQLPKSVWWHSDAQFAGFRIVRPLKVPPPEELVKYWSSGVEKD